MFEALEVGQALERGRTLPYALVRSLSRVALGPTPEETDLSELTEARFFGPEEEVRVFRGENGMQAVRLWEEAGEPVLERSCELANKSLFGHSVTVRQRLSFDGDGQAFVSYTRLSGWKGGR